MSADPIVGGPPPTHKQHAVASAPLAGHRQRHTEDVEVCIVGGGPAGLTTALTLGAAGRRVVLLESGGLGASPATQRLNHGDQIGVKYAGLGRTRHRQIGGTANLWDVGINGSRGAKYVPLSARDFSDWPFGWEELQPFYAEAQVVCGLGPFEYEADRWTTPTNRPFDLDGTGLMSGVYQFGYSGRFTIELVEKALACELITVITNATVVQIGAGTGSAGPGEVRAIDKEGRTVIVTARAVVLACGAVENARLLLLSEIGHGAPLLGRCFMEHVRDFSLVLVPHSTELFAAASFYDQFTSEDGYVIGGRLTLTDDAINRFRLPNASITLVPRAERDRGRRAMARVRSTLRLESREKPLSRYGWSRVRSPATTFDYFEIILNLEQRPDPRNRVELSNRRDRFGNQLPRLSLHWSDEEQRILEDLRDLLGDWFQAARLGHLRARRGERPNLSAHHHAGTTRMSVDRKEGVVDPDSRVFGVDNVYIAGASVFPTAGFANPTLTVVALACRLGRHLDGVLR
jgi:choline dehydrogenase-like flavoprotein